MLATENRYKSQGSKKSYVQIEITAQSWIRVSLSVFLFNVVSFNTLLKIHGHSLHFIMTCFALSLLFQSPSKWEFYAYFLSKGQTIQYVGDTQAYLLTFSLLPRSNCRERVLFWTGLELQCWEKTLYPFTACISHASLAASFSDLLFAIVGKERQEREFLWGNGTGEKGFSGNN